jgi:hypothetical protein
VRVEVVHRELSAVGAKALGATDIEDLPMASAKVRVR